MEKLNEKLKKRILEEIYETCVKKKFLKHEKNRIQHQCFRKNITAKYNAQKYINIDHKTSWYQIDTS